VAAAVIKTGQNIFPNLNYSDHSLVHLIFYGTKSTRVTPHV